MNTEERCSWDVIVVGGGMAGLSAAAFAARAGARVLVLEAGSRPGGRARSKLIEGYVFNLGPHALYLGGVGQRILDTLDVSVQGGIPDGRGGLALRGQSHSLLPSGPVSLLATRLLSPRGKWEAARRLSSLTALDLDPWVGRPLVDWLDAHIEDPTLYRLFEVLVRVSSYCDDPVKHDAAAALDQARRALNEGVRYVDGGWTRIVDGMVAAVRAAGSTVRTAAPVAALDTSGGRVTGVRLEGGARIGAHAVVLAVGPAMATELVARGAPRSRAAATLRRWKDAAIPVHAATLDVALSRLPHRAAPFALGLDEPTYVSLHSRYASLAPPGTAGQLVHAMSYLPPGGGHSKAGSRSRRALETTLERVVPGWREACVHARFLPHVLVEHAMPTASQGGLAGRPGPRVRGLRGLYVAGDWVGSQGRLAEASLASGREAARLATRSLVTAARPSPVSKSTSDAGHRRSPLAQETTFG